MRKLLSRCALVYTTGREGEYVVRLRDLPREGCVPGAGAGPYRLVERAKVLGLACYALEEMTGGGCEDSASETGDEADTAAASRICGYAVFFGGCSGDLRTFVMGMRRTVLTRGAERPYLFHVFQAPGGAALPSRRVVVSADLLSLSGFRGRGPMDVYDNVIAACGRRRRFEDSRIASHKDLVDTLMNAYARYSAKPNS